MAKYQKYDEYQDSGVEWVGEIPKTWEVKPVFALFSPEMSKNLEGTETNVLSLSYGRIIQRDVENNHGLLPESFNTYQIVNYGDIILRLTDLQNDKRSLRVGLATQKGIITSAYLKLSALKEIEPRFAYRLLHSYDTTKVFYGMGGGLRQSMKFEDFRRLPILVPSKDEQVQIANFLDHETAKIDTLIAKQEKLIELLKEKRQAVISHAVTKGLDPSVKMKDSGVEWLGEVPEHWVRYAIKNLCYVNDGNHGEEYPTEADFVENGEGVPFIRAGDFENFRVVSKNLRYISHQKNNSMRKGRLQENDILFVNRGATIGKLCIIDKAYAGSNLNSQIAYLRADKTLVDYRYLTYFLSSLYTQTNIISSIYGGALPQYPIQNIINLDVWSGGLEEQSMIADYLDEQVQIIVYLIGKCELVIKLMQERRTALISAAVTGKIDVRDWQSPNDAKMEFSA